MEHVRQSESERRVHVRYEDRVWVYRYRWIKRITPLLIFIGGFAWHEAWEWYKGIPSKDKTAQYDAGVALIPDFYRLQSDVVTLRRDLKENAELTQEQRLEIIHRLDTLDERLTRWFERASTPKPR